MTTVLLNKLNCAIEQVEDGDVTLSHLAILLRKVEARLRRLELGIVKINSALRTNPITGTETALAVIEALRDGGIDHGEEN